MIETFLNNKVTLHPGDCLDVLARLEECSVDSVVTDPPYGLKFMGKHWDHGVPGKEYWYHLFHILKPGGHLIAFAGTRTYHRMTCAIEDAGFEIRDQIGWAYGSGFPKSHDVSKGIDRAAGAEREVVGLKSDPRYLSPRRNSPNHMDRERGVEGGHGTDSAAAILTSPATDAARAWQGWGTALKPAWEPICLARKPLIGTVAENVQQWGTGALNIDGCRVATDEAITTHSRGTNGAFPKRPTERSVEESGRTVDQRGGLDTITERTGRWPANIVHDGSDEVVAAFPESDAKGGLPRDKRGTKGVCFGDGLETGGQRVVLNDEGSAARFFYTAKADSDDRIGSKHPTIKPIDLMQWLVRLVTPPGGVVLDPFAGTGTTAEAAFREGMRAVLIEREEEYQADIRRRMALVLAGPEERQRETMKASGKTEAPGPLFDESTWATMWKEPWFPAAE